MTSRVPRKAPSPKLIAVGPDDAPALARIHAAGFPKPWTADDFALFLRQQGVVGWAAATHTTLQGFILVRHVADEAEIMTVAVMSDARQQGLGRALLHHAMEDLRGRGIATLHLEVAKDNHAALALYRALGFAAHGKRRNYYKKSESDTGTDAALMRCDL